MAILVVIIVLLVLLVASTWSSARSYFAKGRLAGMEEATLEIIRGIRSHYEEAGLAPDDVTKAVAAIRSFARGASGEKSIRRYHARLWIFGDAAGAACWRKGYDACKQQMTPVADDKIRLALSVGELMHLTSLAHLGFKKMMPNDRGIEMHRFEGEAHALEGAHAVEKLEQAIPENRRPFEHSDNRQALIRHWWPLERKSA